MPFCAISPHVTHPIVHDPNLIELQYLLAYHPDPTRLIKNNPAGSLLEGLQTPPGSCAVVANPTNRIPTPSTLQYNT